MLMNTYIYIHLYIYIYMYIHIHIYIYIYIEREREREREKQARPHEKNISCPPSSCSHTPIWPTVLGRVAQRARNLFSLSLALPSTTCPTTPSSGGPLSDRRPGGEVNEVVDDFRNPRFETRIEMEAREGQKQAEPDTQVS